jgi:Fic family protein
MTSSPPAPVKAYDQIHQFEPLLPSSQLDELSLAARSVVEKAHRLQGAASESAREQLRGVVRSMNSYYSNRIEGQSTHPMNIDRAMKRDFSEKPDVAKLQRLAVAHIEAEQELERQAPDLEAALRSDWLLKTHACLYGRLSEEDRRTEDGHVVQPGVLRTEDVRVVRHQPPSWQSVPAFLARMDEVYARPWGFDTMLYVIAADHHRVVWTHPFRDGNGRASRLQLHCALWPLTAGLWSVNRGLARQRDRYYELLSNADMARHGDLDGRGNLSERMLWTWCKFFIQLCEDQVSFVTRMLDLNELNERIKGLVLYRGASAQYADYRPEAVLPLHHVLAAGPVTRGEFVQMTGLADRTGRKVLAQLLKDGLLVSDGPKGRVGIGFPLDALHLLLPNLYPEAATTPLD